MRQIGVTQQTFYRCRKLYGGMQRFPITWLIELEKENSRLRRVLGVSERRACHTLVQHRPTQRKVLQGPVDEASLTGDIVELTGQYGHRMINGMLNNAGRFANHKEGDRIGRREGPRVRQNQKKRDGSG